MGPATVRDWLSGRVRSTRDTGLRRVLQELVEQLALASAEAVTLRRLSADGQRLEPVAWYHPDAEVREAIGQVVHRTTAVADSGLWRPVLREHRPVRYHIPVGGRLADAAPVQASHLERFAVRAMMGAPVLASDGGLVGCTAMLRYGFDAPFGDADEALLTQFAAWTADLLELLEVA
ncbi:GAF domain-containing protein [Streptomyces sp. NP160]|uniref:GAF domain-containing protein n=1 Tax=Streptomyces sp. NP160 TaxID=2586637 RepID=UPI0015D5F127|nr:GAF domain-containing protein [Streptomyces sp. NP160]